MILEACVENIDQCILAEKRGANRLELCADLEKGGITPSYGLIRLAKEIIAIPIFVIIRPRGGNFVYNQNEIDIMKYDIENCISLNCEGIVFGILDKNDLIDYKKCEELINSSNEICKKLNKEIIQFTFHMAFDDIPEKEQLNTIENLNNIGFDRILTKGCRVKSPDGVDKLKQYVEFVRDKKLNIIILAGGGVRNDNLKYVSKNSDCREFHGTQIVGPLYEN